MRTYSERIIVTAGNIEDAREELNASDQRRELGIGCEFWNIVYSGGCKGFFTIWPAAGRGAIEFGGDSVWGDWDAGTELLTTEDYHEDGTAIAYDVYGEEKAV